MGLINLISFWRKREAGRWGMSPNRICGSTGRRQILVKGTRTFVSYLYAGSVFLEPGCDITKTELVGKSYNGCLFSLWTVSILFLFLRM